MRHIAGNRILKGARHHFIDQCGREGTLFGPRRMAMAVSQEKGWEYMMRSAVTNMWSRDAVAHDDASSVQIVRYKFLEQAAHEAVTGQRTYTLKGATCLTVADAVAKALDSHEHITSDHPDNLNVWGKLGKESVLAFICPNEHRSARSWDDVQNDDVDYDTIRNRVMHIKVMLTGSRKSISHIYRQLDTSLSPVHIAQIKWWYRGDHGTANKGIFLEPLTTSLVPEFYPDMGDPEQFLKDYLASDQAVLLVAGPPGTGKTTLLRHLICNHRLGAHVVYDETLMNDDSVFQSFLFEADSDIMLIEDADTILSAREDSQNKLMARFLNVSDGLIKLPNKKLVFTTNISDFGRIDPALLRPGRCFDVLHTRLLNLTEAQAAARAAGMPVPTERKEYALAEIFNQGRKPQRMHRKVGF